MKKILLLFITLFSICSLSKGQQYLSSNHITGSGYAEPESFITDEVQNTYLSGFFLDSLKHGSESLKSKGSRDLFLAKYNDDQQEEWFVTIGSTGNERYSKLAFASDGNLLVAGIYSAECIFGTMLGNPTPLPMPDGSGGSNIFLAKYNSRTGVLMWVKTIVAGEGIQYVHSLAVAPSGHILVGGRTDGNATFVPGTTNWMLSAKTGFLAKFTSSGAYLWHNTFKATPENNINVTGIVTTADRYVFTGYTFPTMTFTDRENNPYPTGQNIDNTKQYFFVGAVDTVGNYKWLNNSTSAQTTSAELLSIYNGTVYLTGSFGAEDLTYNNIPLNLPHPGADGRLAIYLLSLDAEDGTLIEAYSNGSTSNDYVYGLQTKNGLLYMAGSLGDPVTLPDNRTLPAGMFVAAYTINADNTLTNIDVLEGVVADDAKGLVFSSRSFKLTGSFSAASIVIGDSIFYNAYPSGAMPNPVPRDVYMAKACPIIGINGTVTDVSGCQDEANNGSIILNVVGGAGPYTYTWSKTGVGVIDSIKTGTAPNLNTGTYTVTIAYNDGQCSKDRSFTIAAPDALSITNMDIVEASCDVSNSKGTITVNAHAPAGKTLEYRARLTDFGGGLSYDSHWVNNHEFLNCPPGIYTVSIRFAGEDDNCRDSAYTSISRVGTATLTPTIESYTCNILNAPALVGSITLETSDGEPQDWFGLIDASTGATVITTPPTVKESSYTFNNLKPGLYKAKSGIVDTEDTPGCMLMTGTLDVSQPPAIVIGSIKPVNVICAGTAAGKITVVASGGSAALYYALYKDESQTPITTYVTNPSGSIAFNDLHGGTYRLVVSDGTCQAIQENIVISDVNPKLEFESVVTQDACSGMSNGKITLKAKGGATSGAVYTYTLSGGNAPGPNISGAFSGLEVATYSAKVEEQTTKCITTYANISNVNEIVVDELSLVEVDASQITSTPVLCNGDPTGTITVGGITGGTGTYTVSIANSHGTVGIDYESPYAFAELYAATYTITIKDNYGCTTATVPQITVTEPNPGLSVSVDITQTIACYGASTGIITASAAGGTYDLEHPYAYRLYKGANPVGQAQTSGLFENLSAGTYMVIVTDQNKCTKNSEFKELTQLSQLEATCTPTAASRASASDGQIEVVAQGGTQPYTFTLDTQTPETGASPHYYTNLATGIYRIRVVDDKGCSTTPTVMNVEVGFVSGVENLTGNNPLQIYPNPSDGQFIIKWDSKKDMPVTIEIFSVSGKLVYKTMAQTGVGTQTTVNISNQPQGTYILRVPEMNINQKIVIR